MPENTAKDLITESGALGWLLTFVGGVILAVLTMWNTLLIFVIRHLNGRINRGEDMAMPRMECGLFQKTVGDNIVMLKDGVALLHRRLDAFMKMTCEHCAKASEDAIKEKE